MNQLKERQNINNQFDGREAYSREKSGVYSTKKYSGTRKNKNSYLVNIGMLFVVALICAVIIFIINNKPDDVQLAHNEMNSQMQTENEIEAKEEKVIAKEEPTITSQYAQFDYYIEENLQRYNDFAIENPTMPDEEVVWKVNANLDKTKYEYVLEASEEDDTYIIVNKYYKVPDDYRPNDLVDVDGHLMREETAIAYKQMREAALQEGFNFYVVDAYRSVEVQRNLYEGYLSSDSRENVDRYSARPGYSEHHTGMALDIFGSDTTTLREFVDSPEYPWVRDNCHKFGFIIRYTTETEEITGYENEPWHIRYVGTEISTKMKEENISTFEEYHAKYLN